MADLTRQDIETLIEAMDAWQTKDANGDILGIMLSGMMAPTKEAREQALKEEEAKIKAKQVERNRIRDRATIIKAKLISIRDSLDAVEFLNTST